jgi:hypothetical protein
VEEKAQGWSPCDREGRLTNAANMAAGEIEKD